VGAPRASKLQRSKRRHSFDLLVLDDGNGNGDFVACFSAGHGRGRPVDEAGGQGRRRAADRAARLRRRLRVVFADDFIVVFSARRLALVLRGTLKERKNNRDLCFKISKDKKKLRLSKTKKKKLDNTII
jgi:hypothetical protein